MSTEQFVSKRWSLKSNANVHTADTDKTTVLAPSQVLSIFETEQFRRVP